MTTEQIDTIEELRDIAYHDGPLEIKVERLRVIDQVRKTDTTTFRVILDGRENLPIGVFQTQFDAASLVVEIEEYLEGCR